MFVNMTVVGFEPSSPYSESNALSTVPWRLWLDPSVILYGESMERVVTPGGDLLDDLLTPFAGTLMYSIHYI